MGVCHERFSAGAELQQHRAALLSAAGRTQRQESVRAAEERAEGGAV